MELASVSDIHECLDGQVITESARSVPFPFNKEVYVVGIGSSPKPHETVTDDLATRVVALEARMDELQQEVRTTRQVVTDDNGVERLVAERVAGAMELRIDLPTNTAGHRTGVLLFSVSGQDDLCAGIGIQLWADGDVVRELTWWADEGVFPA